MHKRTTLTVAVWEGQRKMFENAAKAKNLSLPDYVRQRLLQVAADDAGVTMPTFPEFQHRASRDAIKLAANILGMDQKEFMRKAVQGAAEEVMKHSSLPPPMIARR